MCVCGKKLKNFFQKIFFSKKKYFFRGQKIIPDGQKTLMCVCGKKLKNFFSKIFFSKKKFFKKKFFFSKKKFFSVTKNYSYRTENPYVCERV